jgi:hypothetical protein
LSRLKEQRAAVMKQLTEAQSQLEALQRPDTPRVSTQEKADAGKGVPAQGSGYSALTSGDTRR